jgi:DNA polymerase III subunit delta
MIYFFYGTDEFRIREAADDGIADFKKSRKLPADFPCLSVAPDDAAPERILEYLRTANLFERFKLARIRNLAAMSAEFQKNLIGFMKLFSATDTEDIAVFISYIVKDARKKGKTETGGSVVESLSLKPAHSKKYDKLEGSELASWIMSRAKNKGLDLDAVAASLIARRCAGEIQAISQEIEKLALYASAESDSHISGATPKKITSKEIEVLGWERITQNAFDLIDAIGAGRQNEAMRVLLRAYASGNDPLQLEGVLAYALRNMLAVRNLAEIPVHPRDIPKLAGLGDWQVAQYNRAAARFTTETLKKMLERLQAADFKIKTGEGEARSLIERFVLSM